MEQYKKVRSIIKREELLARLEHPPSPSQEETLRDLFGSIACLEINTLIVLHKPKSPVALLEFSTPARQRITRYFDSGKCFPFTELVGDIIEQHAEWMREQFHDSSPRSGFEFLQPSEN